MSEQAFPLQEPEEPSISYHYEEVDFTLSDENAESAWLMDLIEKEGCRLQLLNYIFCSDEFLHRINLEYLEHDTFTDIITFPYADPPVIEGDIFISVERVAENAKAFGVAFEVELARVMAHGVLHLCGYKDKSPEEQSMMRQKEDESLELRSFRMG
ncbi:MAG: rRNA maturation RNase YbeY [Saprospirales bacterium]|nr:rRNA maturation RNase YbeY [Saprospirales bacterium]